MNIHARQEAIVSIVREQMVHSQDELLSLLRRRGFKVTQPTLSRDIRELGLAKTPAGYVLPGELAPVALFAPRGEKLEHLLHGGVDAKRLLNRRHNKTPFGGKSGTANVSSPS